MNSPDPQQRVLDNWDKQIDDADIPEGVSKSDLMQVAYSLQRTLLSVMLFQRSLSGLNGDVRDSDNLDPLFSAVSVDRTVIQCPTIANRIA